VRVALITFLLVLLPATVAPQKRQGTKQSSAAKPTATTAKKSQAKPTPVDELTKLRQEFIKATNDYKASLENLRASYEKSVARAEVEVAKSKDLFAAGLISRKALEASETELARQQDKITDVNRQMSTADSQIADTLLEADAEKKFAKSRSVPKGGMISSASFIRYNGAAVWVLSDAWKVQQFFLSAFKKPLPVSVFGQGALHDRWRLDHHNAIDVALQPDGPEGQALLNYLRSNGISFLAFRQAIPGTATGPHIHIGRPSHRY
jgi:hypothetical protein